jgi:lipoyl(octanoyl) transferase
MSRQVQFIDFGTKEYKETWDLQEELFQKNVAIKLANRSAGLPDGEGTMDRLIFVEHPHVYTLAHFRTEIEGD